MKAAGFTHDNKNNMTQDWWTPEWVFTALGLVFDLDPASPPGGVPWLPARKHYALPQDGLSLPWEGCVWLNPPYGTETKAWLARMDQHRNGLALVFARTDTHWFHTVAVNADSLFFLRGRMQFTDASGKTGGGGAGAGSLFIAWGEQCTKALRRLSRKRQGLLVQLPAY
jgi:DNA N-6-adenine-methyltransferase (Dam)